MSFNTYEDSVLYCESLTDDEVQRILHDHGIPISEQTAENGFPTVDADGHMDPQALLTWLGY